MSTLCEMSIVEIAIEMNTTPEEIQSLEESGLRNLATEFRRLGFDAWSFARDDDSSASLLNAILRYTED